MCSPSLYLATGYFTTVIIATVPTVFLNRVKAPEFYYNISKIDKDSNICGANPKKKQIIVKYQDF